MIVERVGVKRVVLKVSSWRMNGLIFDNIVNAHRIERQQKDQPENSHSNERNASYWGNHGSSLSASRSCIPVVEWTFQLVFTQF